MVGLSNPIKTPYISIKDMDGRILASTEQFSEVAIVNFEYEFNDEDEDICKIKLQSNNPLAFDNLNISIRTLLVLKWGYIDGPLCDTAIVAIRDLTSKYGKEIIYTELECTDLLNYLQTARADDVNKGRPIDYILNQTLEKYKIVIIDSGKIIYSCGKAPDEHAPVWYHGLDNEEEDFRPFSPYRSIPEMIEANRITQDEKKGIWFLGDSEDLVFKFLTTDKDILSANRSVFAVISGMLKDCPRGPWFVTGRGDTLVIHNRDFIQNPFRYYKYKAEPGYLIDFSAKTKYENFNRAVISYDYLDPKNKKFYDLNSYKEDLLSTRTIKEIYEDKKLTEPQFKKELQDYLDLMEAYKSWRTTETKWTMYRPASNAQIWFPREEDKAWIRAGEMSAQDNTGVELPSKYVRTEKGGFNPLVDDPVLRVTIFSRPIELMDDKAQFIKNEQRMLEMDKEECKAIVIGDPYLQSQMVVIFDGVHSQHKGHYYIKKCQHIISKDGYKTQFEGIKVLPENKIKTLTQVTEETYVDGKLNIQDEYFMQEQMLFGIPPILKQVTIGPPRVSTSSPGLPSKFKITEKIYVEDLYKEASDDDEFIDTLFKLKESGYFVSPNVENR